MCVYFVALMCASRFGLGWAHDTFFVAYHMLMHFHAYVSSYIFIFILILLVLFCVFLSLPLSFVSCSMVPKRKSTPSQNPLHPKTLFDLGHLLLLTPLLLTYGSVMIKPVRTFWRTFLDEAFIWNAKSFYWIFLILMFPLSSTIGVGSHCVASRSLVPPWSYRSFTPTCTDSTI